MYFQPIYWLQFSLKDLELSEGEFLETNSEFIRRLDVPASLTSSQFVVALLLTTGLRKQVKEECFREGKSSEECLGTSALCMDHVIRFLM